jgi:glycosyltransferase involved in cell wall biosynthesis
MKILIVQDFLRSGGTERQAVLLANGFAQSGNETRLLTFRPGGALAKTVAADVDRRALQPFDLGLDWFAPGLISEVQAFSPDTVLCMGRMANCYAGTLQKKFPARSILGSMRTGKTLPAAYRRSLLTVRHVIANSRDARDNLVRAHAVPSEKISVIHNSLVFPPVADGTDHVACRETLRRQHGATAGTVVLLSVAMFRPEKNQRELIEIVAGLPPTVDWQLWLAGDGPTRGSCEALAAARNLTARVKFLGFHSNPSPLYGTADMAVHASASEALSNFLIEAQAHGLPAVAYEVQGIDECFLPDRTGWVVARDDRDAFRRALTQRMSEPSSTRAERAAAARSYAREMFDPQRQVAAYLDLFARLTSRAL